MRRRQFLKALGLGAASAALGRPARAAATPAGKPPNIVLVLVDDMGWTDVGCYGSTYYQTPNVDKLCKEGMKFTQGYAACAVCSPTRASVMTGRYPARIGITDWIHCHDKRAAQAALVGRHIEGFDPPRGRKLLTPVCKFWLDDEEVTIPEMLKPLGYVSCHVGKWHLGPKGWLPQDQGFDFNFGGRDIGAPGSYFDPYGEGTPSAVPLPSRKKGEYLTDREADCAVEFIDKHHDKPFFLYLAHYAVHAPIQAKKDLIAKYKARPTTNQKNPVYAAMVESVDQALGRVLAALDKHKLADNTIVIFTSDNGGAVHFSATDNAPLRKGKGYPYEGGIREPFLVRWPKKVQPGSVCDVPVCSIDLLPTLAEATGAKLPAKTDIDGLSLVPLLKQTGTLKRKTLYWHFPHYWWGTRIKPYSIIREGDWKLIRHYEDGKRELYNLKDDLSEKMDLAPRMPRKVAQLEGKLRAWLAVVGAKMTKPNPEYEEKP